MANKNKPKPRAIPVVEPGKIRRPSPDLWFKIILFVFAFVLYGNTLKNGFSLDISM